MFNIGDLIVYGTTGVCRVIEIGKPALSGVNDGKDYYTLSPYYQAGSRIFTPCDNDRIVMRPIISRNEAEQLINSLEEIDYLTVTDEKQRENTYKDTIKSCDLRSFVSILKTIYKRKTQRIAEGKKVTASDEKYFNLAEDKLSGELAIVLEQPKEMIKEHLISKVKLIVNL